MNLNKKIPIFFLLAIFSLGQNIPELIKKARKNDTDAMLKLHEYYTLKNNPDSAKIWATKLAKLKNPQGLYFVGIGYFRGLGGYKKNIKLGLKYLTEAADSGNTLAYLRLMEIYGDTSKSIFIDPAYKRLRNPAKAFKYAQKAAKAGYREAIRFVANAYFTGKGTEKNDSLAIEYMKKLAENYNDALAQVTLGDWFFYAKTKYKIDNELAKKYYKMAAQNSYADPELQARGRIGLFYIKQLPYWAINLSFTPFILWLPKQIYFDVNW